MGVSNYSLWICGDLIIYPCPKRKLVQLIFVSKRGPSIREHFPYGLLFYTLPFHLFIGNYHSTANSHYDASKHGKNKHGSQYGNKDAAHHQHGANNHHYHNKHEKQDHSSSVYVVSTNTRTLTIWGTNIWAVIVQTAYSNAFFLNENVWISIEISLKFIPKSPISNILAFVQIMAWRRIGDKPLFEPMLTRFTEAYMRH